LSPKEARKPHRNHPKLEAWDNSGKKTRKDYLTVNLENKYLHNGYLLMLDEVHLNSRKFGKPRPNCLIWCPKYSENLHP